MAKATKEVLAELEGVIDGAAAKLPAVAAKRMFGCHALFANGNVFALVWKEGRVGVRLPDAERFEALMSLKGAAPWKAGAMTMSHWVLVPVGMHGNARALKAWVAEAHELALKAPKKAAKAKPKKGG